ncbi:hypothetical protein EJB05_44542, partial [Eragrostis curvula]
MVIAPKGPQYAWRRWMERRRNNLLCGGLTSSEAATRPLSPPPSTAARVAWRGDPSGVGSIYSVGGREQRKFVCLIQFI